MTTEKEIERLRKVWQDARATARAAVDAEADAYEAYARQCIYS